jgi:hypothetical protein
MLFATIVQSRATIVQSLLSVRHHSTVMRILRSIGAILLGYVLVVLLTEFGFRMFPGGVAPKEGPLLPMIAATVVAVAAGCTGGWVAARLAAIRPMIAASIVALPLGAESIWLLTTRTPAEEFWLDLGGAVTLIGSVLAGGVIRSMQTRPDRVLQ